MKRRTYLVGFLFCGLLAFGSMAEARMFETIPDKSVTVRYRQAAASTLHSTYTVLVDLSDTTNWPHKETGYLSVDSIRINVDKAAASTSTVKIGVVNFVDASTGSVTWFTGKENALNVSNTEPDPFVNPSPSYFNLYVAPGSGPVDGSTPYLKSNDTTSGSTVFQTDAGIPSPNGFTTPGVGDIVAFFEKGAAAITYIVEIVYHSNRK